MRGVGEAVGRSAAKGIDAGSSAGRTVRDAADAVPSGAAKSRKRARDGAQRPRPPAHEPRSVKEWPEKMPDSGPSFDDPLLGGARRALGLPFFDKLPEGASTSLEAGCEFKLGDPFRCTGASPDEGAKDGDKGKERKNGKRDGGTDKPTADAAGDRSKGGDRRPPRSRVKFGAHAGAESIGKVTFTKGESELRRNGKTFTPLTVRGGTADKASAGLELGLLGTELSSGDGRSTDYQTTMERDNAERVAKGDKAPPDPDDPESLGKGESVRYSRTKSRTTGGSQHVGLLRFGGDEEEGTTETAGIQRVGKDRVRISVGTDEYVRHSQELGLGVDDLKGSAREVDETRKGRGSEIDVDLSTAAGRRHLNRFRSTGELPPPDARGTGNAAVKESSTRTENGELAAKAGASSGTLSGSEHSETDEKKAYLGKGDERREVTFKHAWGDTNLEQVKSTRRDGSPAPDTTEITVEDADGDAVEDALELRGVADPPEIDDEANVRVDFTNAELERLQDGVIDGLQEEHDDDERSNEEFSEDERRHTPDYDERPTGSVGGITHDPRSYIAAARTPADVGKEVQLVGDERMGTNGGHHFVEELNKLQEDSGAGPPGKITVFNEDGTRYTLDYCGRLKRIRSKD
ncbi:MAG: hypothetical protein M3433_05270 [Actinomycetota bacterium]|nr:hypothetical protein [Actinomycetota bacterium]